MDERWKITVYCVLLPALGAMTVVHHSDCGPRDFCEVAPPPHSHGHERDPGPGQTNDGKVRVETSSVSPSTTLFPITQNQMSPRRR